MAVFITPGPVLTVAAVMFVMGLVGLIVGHQRQRGEYVVGAGAFFATLGVVTAYRSAVRPSDGRAGWRSLTDLYAEAFDSWPYVFVLALIAAAIWALVTRLSARKWSLRLVAGISVGSLGASVLVRLFDPPLW